MATLVQWTGDNVADETALTTTTGYGAGDTPASNYTGTITVDADGGLHAPRLRFDQASGSACRLWWNISSRTVCAGWIYFTTPASWASASSSLVRWIRTSDSTYLSLTMAGSGTPGQLRLYAGTTQLDAATFMSVSTTYRAQFLVDVVAHSFIVKIYEGDQAVVVATLTATNTGTWPADYSQISIGPNTSTPTVPTWYVDDTKFTDDTTWIDAPFVVPSDGTLASWSGAGLAAGTMTTNSRGSGDTIINAVTGAVSIEASGPRAPQMRMDQDTSGPCCVRWAYGNSQPKASGFLYYTTPSTWADSSHAIITLVDSTASSKEILRIMISGATQPGQVRLIGPSGTLATTVSNTIRNSTRYRFAWKIDHATGQAAVKVYIGENGGASIVLRATDNFGSSHDRVWLGNPHNNPVAPAQRFDDFRASSSGEWLVSPWAAPQPPRAFFVMAAGQPVTASMAGVVVGGNIVAGTLI